MTTFDGDPTREELLAKHKEFLFPSVVTSYADPVVLSSGKGSRLEDLDGRSYLDFFGGILTVSLGQAHDRVNRAVHAQIDRLGHVSTLYPTIPIVKLAEKLVSVAPGQIKKAFFTASGSEANETAVALAQQRTGRQEMIALRHGYSGRTSLAVALSGNGYYRVVPNQVAGVSHAPSPYCYRCPYKATYPSCDLACATEIDEIVKTTTSGRIAGFIAEPIQGVGGFIDAPDGYFATAVEIIRKYGGLFIADEVQTGFGRTGKKMWAIEHHQGVAPDIMTLAKGIANGMPIGAVLATAAIADAWSGGNFSTYGGNPVSAAAANATLETIIDEKLPDNAAAMGDRLRNGLEALREKYPKLIGDVRGKGLMQALELVKDETSKDRTPLPKVTMGVFEEAKTRGLLIGKGGVHGNVVRVAPALNIGAADIDEGLRILGESFAAAVAASP